MTDQEKIKHKELTDACNTRDQLAQAFRMACMVGQSDAWAVQNRTVIEHVVRTFKKHIDLEPWKSVVIYSDDSNA